MLRNVMKAHESKIFLNPIIKKGFEMALLGTIWNLLVYIVVKNCFTDIISKQN